SRTDCGRGPRAHAHVTPARLSHPRACRAWARLQCFRGRFRIGTERPYGAARAGENMCRWIAYFGNPIRPRTLLYDTPHGLVEQSRRDRLAGGHPNADGFGLGWYDADGDRA